MECDKYDIFIIEPEKASTNNSIYLMYIMTNVILVLSIWFFAVQLYRGITNQSQNNRSFDDSETKESYDENDSFKQLEVTDEFTEENHEYESLTKENTSFNTYIGLDSWVLNEELYNIIEEKSQNISLFQNKYSIETESTKNLSIGPHFVNLKWKTGQGDTNENSSLDQIRLNFSGVLSTDTSDVWISPNVVNAKQTKSKQKGDKRVRFDFRKFEL